MCVHARVCVFVSLRHMVFGLPSTHGMTKKAASSFSAQCRSVNKSEELVYVACASNNIFVNTCCGLTFQVPTGLALQLIAHAAPAVSAMPTCSTVTFQSVLHDQRYKRVLI